MDAPVHERGGELAPAVGKDAGQSGRVPCPRQSHHVQGEAGEAEWALFHASTDEAAMRWTGPVVAPLHHHVGEYQR